MQIEKPEVLRLIKENRRTGVIMILNCEMVGRELFNESFELLNAHFQSCVVENLKATDESEEFDSLMHTIQEMIQNFNQRGSKWKSQRVISLNFHLSKHRTLNGSSYIELPEFITGKKAVMNIKNVDNQFSSGA